MAISDIGKEFTTKSHTFAGFVVIYSNKTILLAKKTKNELVLTRRLQSTRCMLGF